MSERSQPTTSPVSKDEVLERFRLFAGGTGGIDSWLAAESADPEVFAALGDPPERPLTRALMNQLLTLSGEAPVGKAFFKYYWLDAPPSHVYDVMKTPGFDADFPGTIGVASLDQLAWGFYRFYVDALLFFGNVRTAYQTLRWMSGDPLRRFFESKRFRPNELAERGAPIPLSPIQKDQRYLISEMACKSYEAPADEIDIRTALFQALDNHPSSDGRPISIGELLEGDYMKRSYADRQYQFRLSLDELLEEQVTNRAELEAKVERIASAFASARKAALRNTSLYLSMVGDLDVYVATSMRTRDHFRDMGSFCEKVFGDERLAELHIRYFDPTLSAANNHEDKGLIECLMVKCAKLLVYHAGERESYGKDAEAAMALSLGKPVIFHCDEGERQRFYRDVHPLSRLIDFKTGVAVGAMVANSPERVAELICRVLTNDLEYELRQDRPGYLCLVEKLSGCVVRLQTSDSLLRETFWNYYHGAAVAPSNV